MIKTIYQSFKHSAALLLLLLICGCKSSDAQSGTQQANVPPSIEQDSLYSQESELAFPSPTIPMTMQEPEQRALYYVEHFWENCDFDEQKLLQHPERLEQSLANLLGVALYFPVDKVKKSLIYPLEQSQDSLFFFFKQQYERYLNEPQSPFFNEEYYLPIVEWLAKTPKIDLATQERTKHQLRLMMRNRIGHVAEDFTFITPDSVSLRLSGFKNRATVLMFYSPGCHSCEEVMGQMKQDLDLQRLVQTKKINLLLIDAEDNMEEWYRTLPELPPFGVVGFNADGRVVNTPLYDLKYSPTLYLLDEEGKVVLKDAPWKTIAQRIKQQ